MIRPLPSLICLCAWTLSAEEIPLDPPVLWTPRDGTPILLAQVDTLDHTRGELLEISQGIKDREALARLIKAVGQGRFKPGPAKGPGPLPESNGKAAIGRRKDGSPIFAEDLKGGADFRGAAFLKDTHFGAMDLRTLDFRGAILKETNLSLCQVDPASLQGADLEGAKLPPVQAVPASAATCASPQSAQTEAKASPKAASRDTWEPTADKLFDGRTNRNISRLLRRQPDDGWKTARIPLGTLEGGGPIRMAPLDKGLALLSADRQTLHVINADFCSSFRVPSPISDIGPHADGAFWASAPSLGALMHFRGVQANRQTPPSFSRILHVSSEGIPKAPGRAFTQPFGGGSRYCALGEDGETLLVQGKNLEIGTFRLPKVALDRLFPGPGDSLIAVSREPSAVVHLHPLTSTGGLKFNLLSGLKGDGLVACAHGLAIPGPAAGSTRFLPFEKIGRGQGAFLEMPDVVAPDFVADQAVDGPDAMAVFLSREPFALAFCEPHSLAIARMGGARPLQICSNGTYIFLLVAEPDEILVINPKAYVKEARSAAAAPADAPEETKSPSVPPPAAPIKPMAAKEVARSPLPPPPEPAPAKAALAREIRELFRFSPLKADPAERKAFPRRLEVGEILLKKIQRDHAAGTAYLGGKFDAALDGKGLRDLILDLASSAPDAWEWQDENRLAAWYEVKEGKTPIGKGYTYATGAWTPTRRVKIVYGLKAGEGQATSATVITAYPFPPKP